MRNVPLRLGLKLNLSLLLFMLFLGAATFVLVLVGFNRSQDDAARESRAGLERAGVQTLSQVTSQQAYVGELQLSPAVEWGHQAGMFLASEGSGAPPFDPSVLTTAPSGLLYDRSGTRVTDLVIPPSRMGDEAIDDARTSKVLDGIFPALFVNFEGRMIEEAFRPIAIFYLSLRGVTRYYPPTGQILAAQTTLDEIDGLHGLLGPQKNPQRKTIWTPPYQDEAGRGLVLTAYTPVYEGDQYRGIMGVDVSIDRLTEQVNQIRPTPGGFAFYIDKEGGFLRTERVDLVTAQSNEQVNPAFHRVVTDMTAGKTGVARVELDGREMFVAFTPLNTVGGSLAFVAPVEEMTAEAAGVTEAIESEGNRTVAFILLTMVLFFVMALGGTAWLNRRVLLRPIEALVSGTRAVAAGNFHATIPVSSQDELGDLAASFNRMIDEVRVRNDALHREIVEREQTTRALAEREEGARQVFESVNDALFITSEDRIIDANRTAVRMYGYTPEEFRKLEPVELMAPEWRSRAGKYSAVTGSGERQFRSRALSVRKDGTTFMADVFATGTTYLGERRILTVIRDITEEMQREQLLERRVEERTRELALLLDVSNTVASTLDLQEVFAIVLDQVAEVVPFTGASLLVLEGDALVTRYARGPKSESGTFAPQEQKFPVSSGGSALRELVAGRPVVVADVRGPGEHARDFRWMTGEHLDTTFSRVVSWMALPMVLRGRFVGMIAVSSDKKGAFEDERVKNLAMAVANQAAIALENARLFAEAERRAAEMTALSRIATTLDLEQTTRATLDSVAQRVVESTGAIACTVSTLTSDGGLRLGGSFGMPDGFFDAVEAGIQRGAPRPNMTALSRGEPVVIRHARQAALSEERFRELRPIVESAEWDSLVIVPMRYGDRDLGTIEAYYRANETPDEREVGLIAAMARQAATAIENALLFAQTEKRVRQLEALTQIASSFSLEVSFVELMDRMAEQIVRATTARAAVVVTGESADGPLRVVGAARLPDGFAAQMEESYRAGGGTTARTAMRELRTIYQADLRRQRVDDPRYAAVSEQLQQQSWDSILLTPVIYGNKALGVLLLGYALEVDPDSEERKFIEAVADQTGLVIENARLYQRASAAAALEERQRLARELHDSVSQALYGIALGARTARRRIGDDGPSNIVEPLDYVLSLAEAGLTEMRALIFELRPESIAQEGLVAAIGRQVAATQARYGIPVAADLCDEPGVNLDTKEAVYRIAQESMHNTVKHARAEHIWVSLRRVGDDLELAVRDDGQGFDPSGEFPGHLGLRSMRERARDLTGTLDVKSAPGEGTEVTLRVPFEP